MSDFNQTVIDEFRSSGGKVASFGGDYPLLLLTHRGAKSGREYTTPLVFRRDGERYVIIASKGGAPDDPQWYRNLLVNPEVSVEVGNERLAVRAEAVEGAERDRLYAAQAAEMPQFDEYQAKTGRTIPVVVLTRV